MVGVSDGLLVLSKCSRDMCMEFLWILDTTHRIRVDSVSKWSTQREAPRHTRKPGCSCRKFMHPDKGFWNIHGGKFVAVCHQNAELVSCRRHE